MMKDCNVMRYHPGWRLLLIIAIALTCVCASTYGVNTSSEDTNRLNKIWSLSFDKICGPYTTEFVLRLYGKDVSFDQVCKDVSFTEDIGTSALGVLEGLRKYGLHATLVKLSLYDCLKIRTPMILCLKNPSSDRGNHLPYHFAALIPSDNGTDYQLVAMQTPGILSREKLQASGWWADEVIVISNRPFETGSSVGAFGLRLFSGTVIGLGLVAAIVWMIQRFQIRS